MNNFSQKLFCDERQINGLGFWFRFSLFKTTATMTVYVDSAFIPYGRMKMCHMLADSVVELHAMADRLGLRREWFQPLSRPHYDLSMTKRAEAIAAGVVALGRHELVAMMRRQRSVWVAEYAAARAAGLPHP